jgi:formylglycine-generating enzyme required for sulfatase activity
MLGLKYKDRCEKMVLLKILQSMGSQLRITEKTKKCPFCAEDVKKAARKCKHCHSDISDHVVSISSSSMQNDFTNRLGMKFVLIPAGTFMMGSPSNEPGRSDSETQHQVTISRPFYLQTTEVTQRQWRQTMGNNPSYFKNCGDDCPVENVSWNDVQEFIGKLNNMERTDKYRLPTEAEWEYAARAETMTRFYSGDNDDDLSRVGWYGENSGMETHPVGKKRPNAWGLYDMHGNVWEWVQDWKGGYPSGSVTDPEGPSLGSYRVVRGGSWEVNAWGCRSANRNFYDPGVRIDSLGFRFFRTR